MKYSSIPAGLTQATIYPDFDFETYSEAGFYWDGPRERWRAPDNFPKGKPGLPSIGAAKYAEDPTTELISLAHDLKDGLGAFLWVAKMDPPQRLFNYIAHGGILEAWNWQFEYFIWHYVCRGRMGWPPLPMKQIRCAQAKSMAWGLPPALEKSGDVLIDY